jgi:EAL domain-containing protein (putative c-di-GMP-specific phosphodiesterase class I)
MAMFEAKQAGGGAIRYYRAEMTRRAQERVLLEEDLRRGIDRDQLELHFQTQNRLADGSVAGLEALVRWNHPEQGRLGPDRFIPLAEESGLITAVTKWVARNACRQGRRWLDAGMDFGRLSLNISAVEFRRMDLPGCVRQTLADTGFPADRLILEVTESALAEPDETVLSDLRALQGLGVKLAVDDFGTGYSSLAYLKALPIDALKIDKGFVAGLPDDEHDLAIVRTVLAMGEAMGLEVIAEGIETEAHREFLTEAGCRVGQGFYWGRPSPTPLEALD